MCSSWPLKHSDSSNLQASSLLYRTRNGTAFAPSILEKQLCPLCAGQAPKEITFAKFLNRLQSCVFKVCDDQCYSLNCTSCTSGFLFFGTITYVEETIRTVLQPSWSPVRFLLADLTLVGGVDMSAAEAFVRIHRLLSARGVSLVFCGFKADGPIGKALASVDVLGADGVELFSTFNNALECKHQLR